MRKILTLPRTEKAATTAVRSAKQFAIGASLAVTFCMASTVRAQSLGPYAAPASTTSQYGAPSVVNPPLGTPPVKNAPFMSQSVANSHYLAPTAARASGKPVSTAVAQRMQNLPTVDASYSLVDDQTQVVPAQATGFIPYSGAGDPCNPGCDVSWYIGAELLYFKRASDNNFSLSRNVFLPNWDYEDAGRITIGRLFDCTNGWEVQYAGELTWERGLSITSPGALQSQFQPTGGYTLADISTFNSADTHIQSYRARFNSLEINRRWWVWDVLSTAIGIRYVDYDEEFQFYTSRGGVGTGIYRDRAQNQLLGPQVAFDMVYPFALRGNVGFKGKGGIYANFADRVVQLENAGTLLLNAGSDHTDWAGMFEFGAYANYAIVPSLRVSIGYEFWYLPGIATIPEQIPQVISPASGSFTRVEGNLLMHGGSVGVQVLF